MFCTKAPEFETIVLSKGCMMSKKVCSLSPSCSRLSSLSYCAWKLTSLGVILYEYLTLNTSASVIPVFTRTRKIPSKDSWGFRSFLNDVKRSAFTGTAISVRGLPSFVFSQDSRSLKFKAFEVCLFVQAIYFDYNVYSSTEKCFVDNETIQTKTAWMCLCGLQTWSIRNGNFSESYNMAFYMQNADTSSFKAFK